jgi:hypothetical protein
MDSYWTPAIQMLPAKRKDLGTTCESLGTVFPDLYDVRFIHATGQAPAGWPMSQADVAAGQRRWSLAPPNRQFTAPGPGAASARVALKE